LWGGRIFGCGLKKARPDSTAAGKHIRQLERELARKEKALAEAAALLVLKKRIQSLYPDEDEDTPGPSGS